MQPVENGRASRERHRSGQRLIDVMVNIDEARRHEAAGDRDLLIDGVRRGRLGTNVDDAPPFDEHEAVADRKAASSQV